MLHTDEKMTVMYKCFTTDFVKTEGDLLELC